MLPNYDEGLLGFRCDLDLLGAVGCRGWSKEILNWSFWSYNPQIRALIIRNRVLGSLILEISQGTHQNSIATY